MTIQFQVYLIRDSLLSDHARFMLTSSTLAIELTSSVIQNIYDNQRWNLAVRIKPKTFHLMAEL